jgi:hypothetical protein
MVRFHPDRPRNNRSVSAVFTFVAVGPAIDRILKLRVAAATVEPLFPKEER